MNTLRLNIVTLMVLSMNVKTLRWLSYKQQLVKWGLCMVTFNCCCIKTGHVKVNFHNGNEFIAVSDGFIEARQHQLSIIVQTAEPASEIDVEKS